MLLNEEFLKMYEELTQLNEANEDKQKFIDKFGKDVFDTFWNKKQLLKNKGISVDITYHVARTSKEEMQKILDSVSDANRANTLDAEGKPIPKNTNNFEIVYDGPHYTVYNPQDYIASIYCAHGGRWCTAGGYCIPEGQVKVSQAQQYFNQYTRGSTVLYYFIGKYGDGDAKYALAYNQDNGRGQFFDYYDRETSREKIPYIDEVEIPDVDLEDLWDGYVCEECGDQVHEDEEYIGPNGECYCEDCFFEMYFFCENCGEATDRYEEFKNPDGESICERCFEQLGYVMCEICEAVCDGYDIHEAVFNTDGYLLCESCYEDFIEDGTVEGMAEKFVYISERGDADDFTDASMLKAIITCWNELKHGYCDERFIERTENTFIEHALQYGDTVVDKKAFNVEPSDDVSQYIKITR